MTRLARRGLVCLSLLLAATSCGDASTTPSASGSPSATKSPCIVYPTLREHKEKVTTHMQAVIRALRSFDLDEAAAQLRLAASETRTLADTVAAVNPDAQKHFLRAAHALDQAATSMQRFDVSAGTNWIGQGTNEVKQAVDTISASTYC